MKKVLGTLAFMVLALVLVFVGLRVYWGWWVQR
jgi:hypothetical protein